MAKRKKVPQAQIAARVLNPYVRLRAVRIPNKRAKAAKMACRGRVTA